MSTEHDSDLMADLRVVVEAQKQSENADRSDALAVNFMWDYGDKLLALLEAGKLCREAMGTSHVNAATTCPCLTCCALRAYDEAAK